MFYAMATSGFSTPLRHSSVAPKCEVGSPIDPASGTCNQGDPAREPARIVP